jgi:hypothetical protein
MAMRNFGLLTFLILATLFNIGCGATVYPPAHPIKPVAIYVADYGHHSSVIMPVGDTAFVEYSFGDWNWFVVNHTSACDGLAALFFSRGSALGRRESLRAAGQEIPGCYGTPILFSVDVSDDNVQRVEHDLDIRWQRAIATRIHNPEADADFVVDDRPYSWANDCNEATASILRHLGCQVKGCTYFSGFHLPSL